MNRGVVSPEAHAFVFTARSNSVATGPDNFKLPIANSVTIVMASEGGGGLGSAGAQAFASLSRSKAPR